MTKVYVIVCHDMATEKEFIAKVFTNKKLANNYLKWLNKKRTNYSNWIEDHKIEKFDYSIIG